MKISSPAFPDQGFIPVEYTCDGSNISPPLAWEGAPRETQSFSLIMDDPDASAGVWVHWLVYDIAGDKKGLAPYISPLLKLPDGARQGKNSFLRIGYGGPCPPPGYGAHRYFFKLYALDSMLRLRSNVSREQLETAMKGHILERAEFMGRFQRHKP